MVYLDTSVVGAAMLKEATSAAVLRWLAELEQPAISPWTGVEFESIIARRIRMRDIDERVASTARGNWLHFAAHACHLLPVDGRCFDIAATLVRNAASGLRAADSLHLGIATVNGLSLATLDRRLATIAEGVGIEVLNPARAY